MKFGWNCEIWSKLYNLVKIVKFGQNCEIWSNCKIWSKLWNLVKIVKSGQKWPITSANIIMDFMFLRINGLIFLRKWKYWQSWAVLTNQPKISSKLSVNQDPTHRTRGLWIAYEMTYFHRIRDSTHYVHSIQVHPKAPT